MPKSENLFVAARHTVAKRAAIVCAARDRARAPTRRQAIEGGGEQAARQGQGTRTRATVPLDVKDVSQHTRGCSARRVRSVALQSRPWATRATRIYSTVRRCFHRSRGSRLGSTLDSTLDTRLLDLGLST